MPSITKCFLIDQFGDAAFLHKGETFVLEDGATEFIHVCCDCGLAHLVSVKRANDAGEIHMKWDRIDEMNPEDVPVPRLPKILGPKG